jgi:putative ABC transport system permease protein
MATDRPPGWRRLFRLRDRDINRDVDDELRFHLDMRTEEQMRRGLSADDAREATLQRFGDVNRVSAALGVIYRERARSERRRAAAMDAGQDIGYSLRVLARRPLAPLIIILCLALGIGAATTVFSVGDALLLRPLPYPNGSRLVQVGTTRRLDGQLSVGSFEDYAEWRDRQQTFEHIAVYQRSSLPHVTADAVRLVNGASTSASLFGALGVRAAHGRLFTADDDKPGSATVAVVSSAFADQRLGGAARAVGSMLTIGERRVEIVGVIDAAAGYPDGVEVWLSLPRAFDANQRTTRSMELIGALKEGVSLEMARRDLAAISLQVARENPGIDSTVSAGVAPLRDRYVGSARPAFKAIAAAAGLLLIIACTNVASLQLARGSARAREIAVRSALGATRGRVLRLLLTESLILATIGGAAGTGVAYLSSRVVTQSIPARYAAWMTPELDLRVLAATLVVAMITGLAFGLAPAAKLVRRAPARTLHDGGRAGIDPSRLAWQRGFVAVQMALSVVLLVGAAMAATSFSRLTRQEAGFSTANIGMFRVTMRGERYESDERRVTLVDELVAQLRTIPGVESVGAASHVPIADCCSRFGLHVEGESRAPSTERMVTGNVVTPDFFSTLRIPLVGGRMFTAADTRSAPWVVVINETFARELFRGREPLGRTVHIGTRDATVIGVVKDVKQTTMMDGPEPQFYQAQSQAAWDGLTFVLRLREGIEMATVINPARAMLRRLDPVMPLYRTTTLKSVLENALESQRMFRTLLQGVALVALVLAVAGMYGVTSYFVAQRIPELGIRLALGAMPASLMAMILRQGMVLAGVGALFGLSVAVAAAKFLTTMLYGVSPLEPMSYLLAAGLLGCSAIVACIGPALRALRVEPLVALRSD